MGSESTRTPATEGIHGIVSRRQVSEASSKIPSLRLLSWFPPQPFLQCSTTNNLIYPQNTRTTDQPLPPGLFLYPDYITREEEQRLLHMLDDPLAVPVWKASRFNGQSHGKRWGVHIQFAGPSSRQSRTCPSLHIDGDYRQSRSLGSPVMLVGEQEEQVSNSNDTFLVLIIASVVDCSASQ